MIELIESNPFCEELINNIHNAVEACTKSTPQSERIAAFDADGTLWKTDIGESFFQFQIDQKLSALLPDDPWHHYETLKKTENPASAYLWLAQLCAGQSLEDIRKQCLEHAKQHKPIPVFKPMMDILKYLRSHDFRCVVVTASVKWPVETYAKELGFAESDVIGIETKFSDDKKRILGMEAQGPISWRQGKPEKLLANTNGHKPQIAFGNSDGDVHLLAIATKIAVAVTSTNQGEELFESENTLQKLALEKGWQRHRF